VPPDRVLFAGYICSHPCGASSQVRSLRSPPPTAAITPLSDGPCAYAGRQL
jgi:hypothetical protein